MKVRHLLKAIFALSATLTAVGLYCHGAARPKPAAKGSPEESESTDHWTAAQLVQSADLVKEIRASGGSKPLVICVGFDFLYQSAHIPGAVLYGPGREESGIKALENAAKVWPHHRDIVLYCGCCPMKQCPNLRPAFQSLQSMGFTHLRVLDLEHDFRQDWLQKGLVVEKGKAK